MEKEKERGKEERKGGGVKKRSGREAEEREN